MKTKTYLFVFALLLTTVVCRAEEATPDEIFKKMIAAYDKLDTYSDVGKVVQDIEMNGQKTNFETPFSIKMKKPNMYLITWEQKIQQLVQSGAVWNDGSQAFLYLSATKSYSKFDRDEMALGGATGVSGGAANTVPSLFLHVYLAPQNPLKRMKDPKLGDSQQIEGEDCYVISGSSLIAKEEKFWISKSDYLLRQYARSLEPPEGGFKMPTLTEKQLEDSIKATGQEVTEEKMENMRKMMKQAEDVAKGGKIKGTFTETHEKVSSPKLEPADFNFKVPEGVDLKPFPIMAPPSTK